MLRSVPLHADQHLPSTRSPFEQLGNFTSPTSACLLPFLDQAHLGYWHSGRIRCASFTRLYLKRARGIRSIHSAQRVSSTLSSLQPPRHEEYPSPQLCFAVAGSPPPTCVLHTRPRHLQMSDAIANSEVVICLGQAATSPWFVAVYKAAVETCKPQIAERTRRLQHRKRRLVPQTFPRSARNQWTPLRMQNKVFQRLQCSGCSHRNMS